MQSSEYDLRIVDRRQGAYRLRSNAMDYLSDEQPTVRRDDAALTATMKAWNGDALSLSYLI